MKTLKALVLAVALVAISVIPVSSQEHGIGNYIRVAQHQTNNTTYTPVSSTVRLYTMVVNVTGSPTSWVITVKNKEGTAKQFFSKSYSAASTAPDVVTLEVGTVMTGGIDVSFSGTAGVADIWLTYR